MVPLAAAAEVEPVLVAGTPLEVYEEPDWPSFWQKLRKYALWDLEWYDGSQWLSVKSDLEIMREHPEPDREKFTLIFDASHQGNYRLTFAISQQMREYVARTAEYCYEITYDNMTLVFDWSDAAAIPGIVFTHGVQGGYFWFRMRRDNVPLGAHVEIDPTIIAEYAIANVDGSISNNDHHPSDSIYQSAGAMSFQTPGVNRVLYAVDFRLNKAGNPTGNATAQIFAHGGVFGVSSVPTGAALATSDPFDVSTLTGATTVRFFFTGAEQITLLATTYYCVAYVNPAAGTINTSNYVLLGTDSTPAAAGNAARYINSAWGVFTTRDIPFALWETSDPTVESVTATTAFSAGEYGWVNATVTEDKGVANLNRVDLSAITSNATETFALRWTQATGVFSEESDPGGIVILSGSVRENLNITTDKICFRFALTGATEGTVNVTITVLNDDALTGVYNNAALFSFVGIEWNLIADLINAAFSLFGIGDYMTQITTFINSIKTQFVDSLVGLATLINLQFQVIWNVFTWWTGWATRMITAALAFGAALQMILNGTHPLIAGGVDLWNYFDFASAGQSVFDVAPIFLIVYWINSMTVRARTQGALSVLVGDLQNFANVFSFFMSAFGAVIGFIEGKISWLIQALP